MSVVPAKSTHLGLRGFHFGLLAAVAGSLTLSTGGVLVRSLEAASTWQIVLYRAAGLVVGISVLFWFRHRADMPRQLRASWKLAVLVGPLHGFASLFFILAVTHTTIAGATLPQGFIPLIAAGLGWLVLGEKPRPATVFAILGAGAGVMVMTVSIPAGSQGACLRSQMHSASPAI
jgi:drug/metabolite transporter (DMT)-like permease